MGATRPGGTPPPPAQRPGRIGQSQGPQVDAGPPHKGTIGRHIAKSPPLPADSTAVGINNDKPFLHRDWLYSASQIGKGVPSRFSIAIRLCHGRARRPSPWHPRQRRQAPPSRMRNGTPARSSTPTGPAGLRPSALAGRTRFDSRRDTACGVAATNAAPAPSGDGLPGPTPRARCSGRDPARPNAGGVLRAAGRC